MPIIKCALAVPERTSLWHSWHLSGSNPSGASGRTPGIFLLDVGQGDGIFLTDGHGGHIWIDGGSSSEAAVGTYRMLPFLKYHRVNAVDVWIVTHPDADHISGLEELLEQGYPVHRLLLAKALSEDSPARNWRNWQRNKEPVFLM